MNKIIVLVVFFISVFSYSAISQTGTSYPEFASKLETYFHPDLISDITNELSKLDFNVWSWDVGDFSGDGNNDVAFAIRKIGSKDKLMDVYFFADINGYLVKVGQFQYEYVELPLEVGVAISYGVVYITQKFKQYYWKIESFLLSNGSLIKHSNYTTTSIGKVTSKKENNYYNLRNFEKYITTNTENIEFNADYFTIPSYNRGRFIYKGIVSTANISDIDFCPAGAYWWDSEKDLSFGVNSAYDDMFLYFTINITDDIVLKPYNNIQNGEEIEVWIEPNNFYKSNRFADITPDNTITYRTKPATDIYKIRILAGDFVNKEPEMSLTTINESNKFEENMNENVVCDLTDKGYYVIFKVPFRALSLNIPFIVDDFIEWGATVRVIDRDNEFRPERKTILQSSVFDEKKPTSYGSIMFVPQNKWYGETNNIYLYQIITSLEEFGF